MATPRYVRPIYIIRSYVSSRISSHLSYLIPSALFYPIFLILSILCCLSCLIPLSLSYPVCPALIRLSCLIHIRPIFSVCLIPSVHLMIPSVQSPPVCPVLSSQLFPSCPTARLVPFVSPHRSCFIRFVCRFCPGLPVPVLPPPSYVDRRGGPADLRPSLPVLPASSLRRHMPVVSSVARWSDRDDPVTHRRRRYRLSQRPPPRSVPPPPPPPPSSSARLTRRDRDLYRETRRGVAAVGARPGVVSGVSAACLSTSHRATAPAHRLPEQLTTARCRSGR